MEESATNSGWPSLLWQWLAESTPWRHCPTSILAVGSLTSGAHTSIVLSLGLVMSGDEGTWRLDG